jgi:formamidopyrimidine-DNA glycosylase
LPELPEVETVARSLAPLIEGRQLQRTQVLDRARLELPTRRLARRELSRVFRVGKEVLLELRSAAGQALWLGVHLRMTGRLLWRPAADAAELPHLRVVFELAGGQLVFQDTRRFGTLRLYDSLADAQPAGLDPTSSAFTVAALTELLARGSGKQLLKPWLLRQDRLVGLGNIYAAEIPHHAGLDPRRAVGSLSRAEITRLHRAICEVLAAAIEACGTTFSDFQSGRGVTGSYQQYLRVYGREGESCPRCGQIVQRLVQQQRSTFFCQGCQR